MWSLHSFDSQIELKSAWKNPALSNWKFQLQQYQESRRAWKKAWKTWEIESQKVVAALQTELSD